MFRFDYHFIDDLPKLAWLIEISAGSPVINVYCGKKVETNDNFFVAGVWDGEFESAGFDRSSAFYGSGVKLNGEDVMIVTPSHALDRLVSHRSGNKLVFSNSIPFMLAFDELELDNKFSQYEAELCSVLKGFDGYSKSIPLKAGESFRQYIAGIITVDGELETKLEKRAKFDPFLSYDDYYDRLFGSLKAVKENAVSPHRTAGHFGIVSTLSSGYDSSACSVLAKKLGCDTVLSLSSGRYEEDGGSAVAEALGIENVVLRDCNLYKNKPDCIDAEYICEGELGTLLQFSVFEEDFKDNLVFFGARGSYWEKKFSMTEELCMNGYFYYETDTSISENALKNGYVIIPVPAYGATACSSIKRISNSDEMKPWSIGEKYDKPIPRRIIESAGVKRGTFATEKRGGGYYLGYETYRSVKRKMSHEGYASFREFLKSKDAKKIHNRQLKYKLKYIFEMMPTFIDVALMRLGLNSSIVSKPIKTANPGAPALLILWANSVMKERYKKALKNSKQG